MNKLFFQTDAISNIIRLGICLIAFAIADYSVKIVYASCPDVTVRSNSPCATLLKTCAGSQQGCTTRQGETTASGDFQCDSPSSGSTCIGTGNSSLCKSTYACKNVGGNCVINEMVLIQNYTAETKKGTQCPS
ncbi:MAG: hypothetical protein LBF88_04590 [Planctomycetaceae bacterium]|nr:hypothetical protein [Planctomycetaceae bacterium]